MMNDYAANRTRHFAAQMIANARRNEIGAWWILTTARQYAWSEAGAYLAIAMKDGSPAEHGCGIEHFYAEAANLIDERMKRTKTHREMATMKTKEQR